MKMRPHRAAHPHESLVREYLPPPPPRLLIRRTRFKAPRQTTSWWRESQRCQWKNKDKQTTKQIIPISQGFKFAFNRLAGECFVPISICAWIVLIGLLRRFDTVFQRPYRYFSIAWKVFFFLSDRYKIFTSNWLWTEICENVVLSKIDITMTTINKKLWNW